MTDALCRARRLLLAAPLFAALSALASGPAVADAFDRVLASGTLRVGLAAFAPWTIERDGALIGHEVDLAERLAEDMGVEAELKLIPFGEIIGALHAGEIDMIAAGLAITPERALQVAFTRPYFRSGVSIATNTGATEGIDSLRALDGEDIAIAFVSETLSAELAPRLFRRAEHMVFDTAEEAQAAVLAGEAQVYLASEPEARFFALRNPGQIDMPLAEPLVGSAAGFAVAHGEHTFLAFLNAWIVARSEDRFIPATYDFWFRSLEWDEKP